MLRTFFWYFLIGLMAISSIPLWFIALCLKKDTRKRFIQACCNFYVPILIKVAGMDIEKSGEENLSKGPALYVSNHQGLFDMLLLLTQLDQVTAFLAKIEASKIPMISSWMKMIGCVFINRGNPRQALEASKQCEEHLKSGKSLIIFPEGTRSRRHEMGEFKPGAIRCAIKAGVPIIPLAIDGTHKVWEDYKQIRPAKVKLQILEPVETINLSREEAKNLSNVIKDKIEKALG